MKYIFLTLFLFFSGCGIKYPVKTIDDQFLVNKPFSENKVAFILRLNSEEGLIVYQALEKALKEEGISVTEDQTEASLFLNYSLTGFTKNNVVSDNMGNTWYKNYEISYKFVIQSALTSVKYENTIDYFNEKNLIATDVFKEVSEKISASIIKRVLTKNL